MNPKLLFFVLVGSNAFAEIPEKSETLPAVLQQIESFDVQSSSRGRLIELVGEQRSEMRPVYETQEDQFLRHLQELEEIVHGEVLFTPIELTLEPVLSFSDFDSQTKSWTVRLDGPLGLAGWHREFLWFADKAKIKEAFNAGQELIATGSLRVKAHFRIDRIYSLWRLSFISASLQTEKGLELAVSSGQEEGTFVIKNGILTISSWIEGHTELKEFSFLGPLLGILPEISNVRYSFLGKWKWAYYIMGNAISKAEPTDVSRFNASFEFKKDLTFVSSIDDASGKTEIKTGKYTYTTTGIDTGGDGSDPYFFLSPTELLVVNAGQVMMLERLK